MQRGLIKELQTRKSVEALTHYTQKCKDFSKKFGEKIVAHIKTVEKIVAVEKKVVVCMEDNYIFCSFVCSVRGP